MVFMYFIAARNLFFIEYINLVPYEFHLSIEFPNRIGKLVFSHDALLFQQCNTICLSNFKKYILSPAVFGRIMSVLRHMIVK